MIEKRFVVDKFIEDYKSHIIDNEREIETLSEFVEYLNKLTEENKKLKLQNGELLYQIGEVGKNNKTCRECECFIPEIKYCYMWDMEVEADDVVVACDQRKVKDTKEIKEDISNDTYFLR